MLNYFYLSFKARLKIKEHKNNTRAELLRVFFAPFRSEGRFFMSEKRLAVISLIVSDREQSAAINAILSDFAEYVVGRMGVPYKERGVSVICVIVDAPAEVINTITGKIGMLKGVTAKTLMSKL